MKNVFFGLLLALVVGCSPAREVVEVYRGVAGPQGEQGPAGPQGANGHSLVSEAVQACGIECDSAGGSRLDIYVDMDDSLSVTEGDLFQGALIACNGLNGLNGINGLDGVQGAQGEQGAQGIPGAQGPQGDAGAQGAGGAQGLAGPAGQVGPAGAQGAPGPVGPAGPQGPQGTQGAQGPAGSGATLQNYTLTSSCQSVGDGYYAKKSSDDAKLYSNSSCSSLVATVYAEHTSNGDASIWLSATRLAFNDGNGNLRVIKFN